jgi:hypothetical protein
MNNTIDNFRFFFYPFPHIINAVNNYSNQTLNAPMFMDLKNDSRLRDYRFALDNNPRLIPAAVTFYYSEVLPEQQQPESINIYEPIPDFVARSYIVNLIKDLINTEISYRSDISNRIENPDITEEINDDINTGVEMLIRPTPAIAEPFPVHSEPFVGPIRGQQPVYLDSKLSEARIISQDEQINEEEKLPEAKQIAGKTKKKRRNTNKKYKKSYKLKKTYKLTKSKNKKTLCKNMKVKI